MRGRRPFRSERFGPFRGRDEEIRKLRSMLVGSAPVITVTGMPGVGKTRLVAHVVADEAVWVDGADIEDAGTFDPVVERCAIDVGQRGHPAKGPLTVVVDGLERTDLVVPLADFVDDHPMLRVVVTSRAHLSIRGAARLRLTPFGLPTRAASLITAPDQWPAVQCFIDHATVADPNFRITPETATPVLDLLKASGGLPLAIELTTTWLGTLPVSALTWALTDPNQLNQRGPLDLEPSQQNLADTLQMAVAHIPAAVRDLARAIAEFRGPAPLPAIAHVLGAVVSGSQLRDLLESNLVWSTDVDGVPHVWMLPLVAEHLRTQQPDATFQDRHADWLCDTVARHAPQLGRSNSASAVAALMPVVDGLPDVREVFRPGDERAAEVTLALLPYWRLGSEYRESRRRIDAARQLLHADHPLSLWLTLAWSRAQRDCGDMALAERTATALAADEALPAAVRAVAATELLALRDMTGVRPDASLIESALGTMHPDPEVPACVRRWVAHLATIQAMERGFECLDRSDPAAAIEHYQSAADRALVDDNVIGYTAALDSLAYAHAANGDRDAHLAALDALVAADQSLGARSVRHLHDRINRTAALAGYGDDRARADAYELLALVDEFEVAFFVEQSLRTLGLALAEVGDVDTARSALRRSLAVCDVLGVPNRTAYAVLSVALAAVPVGPDAGTRRRLAAAAAAVDADTVRMWSEPWRGRIESLDIGGAEPIALAHAVTLAQSVLEPAAPSLPSPGLPLVTNREREVLAMLADGLSDREIASELVVSIRTAEAHVAAILRKLRVPNRREAAVVARAAGLGASPHVADT